jgi:hypothetical protein
MASAKARDESREPFRERCSQWQIFPVSKVGKQEVALLVNEVFNKGDFA